MPKSPTLKTPVRTSAKIAAPKQAAPKKAAKKASRKVARKASKPAIPQFENPGVEVKQSTIHGFGLFAVKSFRKGDVIGYYSGPEVTEEQDGDHVLWIYDEEEEREYGIDGQNETRFVNHKKDANAYFDGEELQAKRAIRPGEEITHNYGEAWSDLG